MSVHQKDTKKILFISKEFTNTFGWSIQEYVGKSSYEILHKEDQQKLKDSYDLLLQKKINIRNLELRILNKEGEYVNVSCSMKLLDTFILCSTAVISKDIKEI